jgi:c-di-GMP-binding flagellar brake protein YcgR
MQLSAELFKRIVSTLSSDEKSCSRHEKRKEGRVGLRCSVDITPEIFSDSGMKTTRVVVRDISPSGMGFVAHEHIAVGTKLICPLPCENNTSVEVVMLVRHSGRISKGLYNVGVSFDVTSLLNRKISKKPGAKLVLEAPTAVAVAAAVAAVVQ